LAGAVHRQLDVCAAITLEASAASATKRHRLGRRPRPSAWRADQSYLLRRNVATNVTSRYTRAWRRNVTKTT